MKTLREQVTEFHQAFGSPVLQKPTVPPNDRVRLRLRLVAEEFMELMRAAIPNRENWARSIEAEIQSFIEMGGIEVSMVDWADALADLDYVIEGTRLEFGIDGAPIAAEVHRSNLTKLDENGHPVARPDGKVVKGSRYEPPDIEGELRKQGWEGQ